MAGLLDKLKGNAIAGSDQWVWARIVPGKEHDPFKSLAWALDNKLEHFGYRPQEIAGRLAENYSVLNELTACLFRGKGDQAELLLFIDQMEELFTLDSRDKVGPFIELIDYAAHRPRVRIVATLRADFYPHCLAYEPLAQLMESSINLSTPGAVALLDMIIKPATSAGLELEEGLATRLLNDSGNEPGALALTAFALSELYKKRKGNRLTLKAYDEFGGVQGAIGHHAQALFDQLNKPARAAFATVFSDLVSVNAEGKSTRRRAFMKRFEANPGAVEFIARFSGEKGRLLVTDQADENATVEVAHEKLFESWPLLKKWIDKRRDALRLKQQVETAALQWAESGHRTSHLWRHERLEPVCEMLERLDITVLEEPLKSFARKEAERLLEELECIETTHYRRAEIGDRLAQIGDPRAAVGVDEQGLPDIDWVRVPGGRVELADNVGGFDVEPFFIARYTVTYRQYRAFLEADEGYHSRRWWDDLERERTWGEQYRPIDNCPAENVSWFDAMAFCRWLSAQLNYEVSLPAEWQWQQAATGGKRENEYPWGVDWDERLANTSESHLSRTTAVGMYPGGRTLQGAYDMAGNVYEWCLNKYDQPKDISIGGSDYRVLRGGSWLHAQGHARASDRDYYGPRPDGRGRYLGFRVCSLSPIE